MKDMSHHILEGIKDLLSGLKDIECAISKHENKMTLWRIVSFHDSKVMQPMIEISINMINIEIYDIQYAMHPRTATASISLADPNSFEKIKNICQKITEIQPNKQ